MKRRLFASLLASVGIVASGGPGMGKELNYDNWISLDSETLAEAGIKSAYDELLPALRKYIPAPAPIEERINNDNMEGRAYEGRGL